MLSPQIGGTLYRLQVILIGLLMIIASGGAMAGEKGYLGISLSVDGDGLFLNPRLKTVRIDKVITNGPAAKAGIEAGDLLLEVEGKKVFGSTARDLLPYMNREVGQTVRLAVQRSSGEVRQFEVVAGPKLE